MLVFHNKTLQWAGCLICVALCGSTYKFSISLYTSCCFFSLSGYQSSLYTISCFYIVLVLWEFDENDRIDVKIRTFPIPIAYWYGFGIFKQNQGNPKEIRMVRQEHSDTRACGLCATFLSLTNFDVICDVHCITEQTHGKWNLFVHTDFPKLWAFIITLRPLKKRKGHKDD